MRYYPPGGQQIFVQNRWTPTVRTLIIANCAVFMLQIFTSERGRISPLVVAFALNTATVLRRGALWQFVTYMFLHGGVWHIFFNMLSLWMFGSEVERRLGSRRFCVLYFGSGFLGAVFHFLSMLYLGSSIPMIGASGGVFGVLIAFAMYCGDAMVLFFFFPMKARTMAIAFVIINLVNGISELKGAASNVAHFAHLGGALFGFLYIRAIRAEGRRPFFKFPKWRPRRKFKPRLRRPSAPAPGAAELKARVDEILDKIQLQGIGSLTEEERRILDEASRKL